jgi:hypothetical protein
VRARAELSGKATSALSTVIRLAAGTDIVARTIAPKFLESQGQTWYRTARRRAGHHRRGARRKSSAGRYTLLMYQPTSRFIRDLQEPAYDFLQVVCAGDADVSVPMILIVHPSVPRRSVKELLAEGA